MYQNKVLKVFILDSSDEFRSTCKENLSSLGVDIIGECDNGASALNMIPELKPDVVLLDLWFSGLDCTTLISEVKKRLNVNAPKFILVTGITNKRLVSALVLLVERAERKAAFCVEVVCPDIISEITA